MIRWFLYFFVFLMPFTAAAQIDESGGFIYKIKANEEAPFAGILFDYESVAAMKEKVKVDKELAEQKCTFEADKTKLNADEKLAKSENLNKLLLEQRVTLFKRIESESDTKYYIAAGTFVGGVLVTGVIVWLVK